VTGPDPLLDDAPVACPRCQADNPRQHRFCADCGQPLPVTCASCGLAVAPGARFCGGCGEPLARAGRRFASPDVYTPRHLADRIRTTGSALTDERKQVTVLFADVSSSLELLSALDPEEARHLLDPVLAVMMEAVHRYEGTVNQVLGDGIMAIFGAPLAHENHAVRAAYAALRMHDRVRRVALDRRRLPKGDVVIRVGMNSGEVVVRSIGSDLHMDYTAIGQTTHLASRMEQLAPAGSTFLTTATLRLIEGYVAVAPRGPMPVKGLAAPVEVYELIGAGPARYRLQAAAVRGLSRFVGRRAELEHLHRAQRRAGESAGQVVALVGDPGVGKSRLVREFLEDPSMTGWLTLEARPIVYRKTPSWRPIVDLLARYCHVDAGDDANAIRTKVGERLRTLDPALEPVLPALLSLADIPTDDAGWLALDPQERRRRTIAGVQNIFLAASARQPLVLVVEDLHRIDEETQALLDGLVRRLAEYRVLLVVTYRPEYRHRWADSPHYTERRVAPLEPATAYELLDALLGASPDLIPLKSLLVDRTDGNPLFLEESVRTLVETRALIGEPGGLRLAQPLREIRVPSTVQAVLATRIDRLTPEAKHLLQSAAVVGKDVPFAVLEAIADLPEDALREGLAHLQAAGLLYEANLFPELEYTFKHALTHDVAYGGLLHATRHALHARIVDVIERLYQNRLTEQVERLAHHALAGGLTDKAVAYLRQAGAKAAARSAHREAVAFYEQAIETLDSRASAREARETAIDLVFELRASLAPLGEFSRTLAHLRRAAEHAEAIGDRRRLGWVSAYLTQSHYTLGDQDAAIRAAEQALELADAIGEMPIRIVATFGLGQAHHVRGNYAGAQAYLYQVMAAVDGEQVRERWGMAGLVSVGCRLWLSASLSGVGRFAEAVDRAREAVKLAEAANHPWSLGGARMALGYTLVGRGHLAEAIPVLEQGIASSREMDIAAWLPMLMSSLGAARARGGQPDEGVALLEEGVARARALSIVSRQSLRLTWLAEAYLLAGRTDAARAAVDEAHHLALAHGEQAYEAWALRMLGEVEARRSGGARAAEGYYARALARAEAMSMRPLAALSHLGLAALRPGEAGAEHRAIAIRELTDMDMRYWLAVADAPPYE
jgi:class 3 adenylate cyclase/tetratricopeptide (TPR) repeat protein